jgi:hypothetical protein
MSQGSGGRVILLSKQAAYCSDAWKIARDTFGPSLEICSGATGDPIPDLLAGKSPEWLISFLSPWIVGPEALARARAAINFHPGSSDYPGSGCYNFALYEGARDYGPVCHHMLERVDTGADGAARPPA